jgi:hypothetical protein
MITFPELLERLSTLDEITLLELLDTDTEEIIEMYINKIEDMQDKLKLAVINQ